jgi:hypothetical protein
MNKPRPPILTCYDGSPGAARAIGAAGRLLAASPAIVLYAWPGAAAGHIRRPADGAEAMRRELREEVRSVARRQAEASPPKAHNWPVMPAGSNAAHGRGRRRARQRDHASRSAAAPLLRWSSGGQAGPGSAGCCPAASGAASPATARRRPALPSRVRALTLTRA